MLLSGDGKGFRIDIVILLQRYGYLGSPDLRLLLGFKENLIFRCVYVWLWKRFPDFHYKPPPKNPKVRLHLL